MRDRRARNSQLAAVIALAIIALLSCSPAEPLPPLPRGADLFQAPVYFERFHDKYAHHDDLPLLRAGKVRINLYQPVDVSSFDWTLGSSDYTWFMQMQELRFLLPLIGSERRGDRKLARSWLERWHNAHAGARVPAHKWGEPRTFAYRALVFVYYLKTERARPKPDADVVELLTQSLAVHQQFLERDSFDGKNNLGLIEALGLMETTRVYPNDAARTLAFERVRAMMRKLVSPLGSELENSPAYHFVVLNWLEEINAYLHDLPGAPADVVRDVESVASRMRAAAYFLSDHTGRVPQVGDTDSMSVAAASDKPPNASAHFWDRIAGYAAFKGVGRDRRYLLLRIPLPGARLTEHMHSDALGLWFSDDGEVILGDAGRYTYTRGALRDYFVSAAAHNTVLPRFAPQERTPSHVYRPVAWARDESRGNSARWWAVVEEVNQRSARQVTIADGSASIVVVDSIETRGRAPHDAPATVLWNLGADVIHLELAGTNEAGTWWWNVVTRRGRQVRLSVTVHDYARARPRVRALRGEESPMRAWYSPRWGVRRPVWGIEVVLNARPTAVLETRLTLPLP